MSGTATNGDSGSEAAPAGDCAICHADCAGRPHAIDVKGRVICRPCMDRIRDWRRLATPEDRELMGELLESSRMFEGRACPWCFADIDPEAVLCVKCGYNRKKGKRARRKV